MKFAGEISTDPGERAEEWEFAVIPGARHIGENRKDGDFVVVIPKNERVVREEKKGEDDDDQGRRDGAEYFRTRGSRFKHCAI